MLPPFTLIHKRMSLRDTEGQDDPATVRLRLIRNTEPQLGESLSRLKPQLRRTLLDSTFALAPHQEGAESVHLAIPALTRMTGELNRQPKVITAGIWDLGTHAGFLPRLLEKLNIAQGAFTFFKIQAAIPSGMVSQPARVAAWAREHLGRSLRKKKREQILNNVLAEDFFRRAEEVRRDLGVGYLVGVTPSMVAGADADLIYWNHFSTLSGRLILASAYELREFAQEASRPFEAAIAFIAIAELLIALNRRLDFHDDRGCLFDYNQSRISLVPALKEPHIEEGCLRLIAPSYREAAVTLMKVLRAY
jgi:hypothetical protein